MKPCNSIHHLKPHRRGFTIVEVVVAVSLVAVTFLIVTQTMLSMNQQAAVSRVGTNARVVVERNITQVLGAPFTGSVTHPILAITPAAGQVYDEDGGGDNFVTIVLQESNKPVIVKGTLTRIVTAVSNPENADIRRVTMRLDYTYRGKPYSFEMTTLRSQG